MRALLITLTLTLTSCLQSEADCKAKCYPHEYRWHERGVCDCQQAER
jgi:hypothetical protein